MAKPIPSILFLVGPTADYLADGILHGLRSLYGASVVDYPKCEPLYNNCPALSFARVRGHGFTLYGTLPDIEVDRCDVLSRLQLSQFDYVIFGNINRQYSLFVDWYGWLRPENTILLDGEDTQAIAPYQGRYWRKANYLLLPKSHAEFNYFKREWGPMTWHYRSYRLWPNFLCGKMHESLKLKKISFSIPKEKIITELTKKTQEFASHIVDPEIASKLGHASENYRFTREEDYYADLQRSRFGITTKRAGWDCLRHYEIAANGSVPCFKNLHLKPDTCAPAGLTSSNCINYSSFKDLMLKTRCLTQSEYEKLRQGALEWARANTTEVRAGLMINDL